MKCIKIHIDQTLVSQNEGSVCDSSNWWHRALDCLMGLFEIAILCDVSTKIYDFDASIVVLLHPSRIDNWVAARQHHMFSTPRDHKVADASTKITGQSYEPVSLISFEEVISLVYGL